MKHYRLYGCLALLLALCLTLSGLAVAQEEREFSLIAYPETTDRATNAVGFGGVPGESYALWQGFEGTWQDTPQTVTLALDEEEGAFTVECVPGVNDFVLTGAQGAVSAGRGRHRPSRLSIRRWSRRKPPRSRRKPLRSRQKRPQSRQKRPQSRQKRPQSRQKPPPNRRRRPRRHRGNTARSSCGRRGDDVLALQQGLAGLGYNVGREDGIYGPRTRAAVMRFQRAQSLTRDGDGRRADAPGAGCAGRGHSCVCRSGRNHARRV